MTGIDRQNKILVTGGKGRLAQELLRIDPTIDAPSRQELDFSAYEGIHRYCQGKHYGVIIHAGAVTNKFNENVDEGYIQSNIVGTANVVLWALRHNVRVVYISSDYVYPSERGGYTEESVLYPVNRYAKSKLGGEMAAQLYENSLIIRTSFYSTLDFAEGCTDQYTSRIPIREAAKAIYKMACMKDLRGVINLGTKEKRSLYDIIKEEFNPAVRPCHRSDIKIPYILPPDSSFDTSKYHRSVHSTLKNSKYQAECRICRSTNFYKYLDLGSTPLANSYLKENDLASPEFREELAIQLCLDCGLSQLTKVVHPDLMFKSYLYASSTTQTFRDHCEELARTAIRIASAKSEDLVLDVASNDGCLLSKFREQGMNVLGIDPAENLAAEANASGIRTLCAYWSKNLAKDVLSRFGEIKIVAATNVFAHVDDVHEFVEAVNVCMARRGIFVIEFPYVVDFVERNEFDTAYHEHLSYLGIHPVLKLVTMHALQVFDVQYFPNIHGGTVRVFVSRNGDYPVSEQVARLLKKEEEFALRSKARYESFGQRILGNKRRLCGLIRKLREEGNTIWAYGASAKGNTLMNFFELDRNDIPVVIDDNPRKWGYLTPGSHMRITGIEELRESNVNYLLLLAWNFQNEIINRCKSVNYQGKYILPIPEATIISRNYGE